jgi:hypothetical protein
VTLAIAHQGDHTEHLENTIEAFESAAALVPTWSSSIASSAPAATS